MPGSLCCAQRGPHAHLVSIRGPSEGPLTGHGMSAVHMCMHTHCTHSCSVTHPASASAPAWAKMPSGSWCIQPQHPRTEPGRLGGGAAGTAAGPADSAGCGGGGVGLVQPARGENSPAAALLDCSHTMGWAPFHCQAPEGRQGIITGAVLDCPP